MTTPLPKWIQKRYSILWNNFKNKEFTYDQIEESIKDIKGLSVFLSDLRKAGWLQVSLNSEDTRKRVYKLKNPELIFNEMSNKD